MNTQRLEITAHNPLGGIAALEIQPRIWKFCAENNCLFHFLVVFPAESLYNPLSRLLVEGKRILVKG